MDYSTATYCGFVYRYSAVAWVVRWELLTLGRHDAHLQAVALFHSTSSFRE